MKKYVFIDKEGIEFKNLLSGPAQIGRILNYIIYAGDGILKHRPGNRNDTFANNIGSAWCIEFMIGLGLVRLDSIVDGSSNVYYTRLTPQGMKIYNILVENAIMPVFEHKSNSKYTLKFLKEHNALNIVNVFEEVFRQTIIFKDLCIFLDLDNIDTDELVMNKDKFMEGIFSELCEFYTKTPYIRKGHGASTAGNRVPSLLQLLEFLKYAYCKDGDVYFNIRALKKGIFNKTYRLDITERHLISEYEKEEKILNRLADKYGIEGNRTVSTRVRLSQAQLIFKERLKREHGSFCWLCGIKNDNLLLASHIKDSSLCNIYDKAKNNNGLLLCAQHDKLFDSGLISFEYETGKVMISKSLTKDDRKLSNISEDMRLQDKLMTDERRNFLKWHNDNKFFD